MATRELKQKFLGLHTIDKGTHFEESHKKIRLNSMSSRNSISLSHIHPTWDYKNYSWSYDSLFTVLYHIWNKGQLKHKRYFGNGMQLIQILHSQFTPLFNEKCTFESVHDHSRSILHNMELHVYIVHIANIQ